MGGPSPNPDDVFVYKLPRLDMESATTMKEMTGTMSFTFVDAKKVSFNFSITPSEPHNVSL